MDDKKIKEKLSAYRPELTSDFQFMATLGRNLDAVEHVKNEMRTLRRRNRIAVAIAAVAGFVAGALITLIAPLITGWAATAATVITISSDHAIDIHIPVYIAAATVSAFTAYNAYKIALGLLGRVEEGGGSGVAV